MKVVILAGGKGTRISEESRLRPKPMVEIGGNRFCGILCGSMPLMDLTSLSYAVGTKGI